MATGSSEPSPAPPTHAHAHAHKSQLTPCLALLCLCSHSPTHSSTRTENEPTETKPRRSACTENPRVPCCAPLSRFCISMRFCFSRRSRLCPSSGLRALLSARFPPRPAFATGRRLRQGAECISLRAQTGAKLCAPAATLFSIFLHQALRHCPSTSLMISFRAYTNELAHARGAVTPALNCPGVSQSLPFSLPPGF